ncbi:aminotransferase class V-fold PLP-dependent enzyme [Shigella flexneri]
MIDAEAEVLSSRLRGGHRGIIAKRPATKMENVPRAGIVFYQHPSAEELVFVRGHDGRDRVSSPIAGATATCGRAMNIIISQMEHHANISPGRCFAPRVGAAACDPAQSQTVRPNWRRCLRCFDEKTGLLAITHVSNVLGTENPLAEIVRACAPAWRKSAGGWRSGGDASSGGVRRWIARVRVLRA